jgi:hypothetical protein
MGSQRSLWRTGDCHDGFSNPRKIIQRDSSLRSVHPKSLRRHPSPFPIHPQIPPKVQIHSAPLEHADVFKRGKAPGERAKSPPSFFPCRFSWSSEGSRSASATDGGVDSPISSSFRRRCGLKMVPLFPSAPRGSRSFVDVVRLETVAGSPSPEIQGSVLPLPDHCSLPR